MAIKRIGILTVAGDVPGLNAVIKSATYRSSENDIDIFGIRRGWETLTHLNIEDASSRSHYVTVLHTSRTNPAGMRKLPAHLVAQDFPASLSAKGGEDLGCLQAGAGKPLGARHRTSDRDRRRLP
jgi:ATP-dependent phosphofructokinase / diphosphate-dependent phosphofructokinase